MAADPSVAAFHGRDTLRRYVLTLLNVVSAIYGDPTLGANLQFVVRRLVFFEGEMHNDPIREGNSKQSLANVSKWNKRLLASLPPQNLPVTAIKIVGGNESFPVIKRKQRMIMTTTTTMKRKTIVAIETLCVWRRILFINTKKKRRKRG